MWFIFVITCIRPVELGLYHDFNLSETPPKAWWNQVLSVYENPKISVTYTLTRTYLTHIQPLCSDPPPQAGTLDLISWWQVQDRGGEDSSFFGWGEDGEDTGRAARLTGEWGCRWGLRCRDVQGVGVCGSKDKHQWEYEKLDGNLSQEVRLCHCRRNHRREADLVRVCSAASDFRGGGRASHALQTGRHSEV